MIWLTLTLKVTTAQVVETSVTVNNNPIQDYAHQTIILNLLMNISNTSGLLSAENSHRSTLAPRRWGVDRILDNNEIINRIIII